MPSSLRPFFAVLVAALLLVPFASAFQSPLSEQAVREAYFLGQRHDDSLGRILARCTKFLPPPASGPYVHSIAFLTPFAQLVEHSSQQLNYSAQQAAKDHQAEKEIVVLQIEVLLTQSYGAYITKPTSSRSDAPIGIQFRSSSFWKDIKFQVFDGGEERAPDDFSGRPTYFCAYKGGCRLTGAVIRLEFPATAFTSDSATIDVTPPEGEPVSVDFDLSSLR